MQSLPPGDPLLGQIPGGDPYTLAGSIGLRVRSVALPRALRGVYFPPTATRTGAVVINAAAPLWERLHLVRLAIGHQLQQRDVAPQLYGRGLAPHAPGETSAAAQRLAVRLLPRVPEDDWRAIDEPISIRLDE